MLGSQRLLIGLALLCLAGCGGPQAGRDAASAPVLPTAAKIALPSLRAAVKPADVNTDAPVPASPSVPSPVAPMLPASAPAVPKSGTPIGTPPQRETFARAVASGRGLDYSAVLTLLQEARYNATVVRLIAPSGPVRKTVRAWPTYRQRYVERIRIRDGVAFMQKHAGPLARAQVRYGVPAHVIAAIIGVETLYGRQTGSFRTLDVLATLAFHYPVPERADRIQMFRDQLADLIALHFSTHLDARTLQGSFAGAIGVPQFMPGSIKRYAVDADGDGRIDLHGSIDDVVMSVGNFLVQHGWRRGLPIFASAQLPADPSALVDGGLEPTLTWDRLRAAGAREIPDVAAGFWQDAPLGVIDLPDERVGHVEYRIATPNFFALTQYNRSYFYAAAVADLAMVLQQRTGKAERS